jgi:hypothetical protein
LTILVLLCVGLGDRPSAILTVNGKAVAPAIDPSLAARQSIAAADGPLRPRRVPEENGERKPGRG